MLLRFEVPGAPVSKNQGARIDPARMRLYRPKEATEWMKRIRTAAWIAAFAAGWPSDPFRVSDVAISFFKFDCKHDSGAGNEYVFDALQIPRTKDRFDFPGWGLYANDKVAWTRESRPPIQDGKGRRCAFVVELLGMRSSADARRLRLEHEKSLERSLLKRVRKKYPAICAALSK